MHHHLRFFFYPSHRRGKPSNGHPIMLALAIVGGLLLAVILIGIIGSAIESARIPDPQAVTDRALALMPTTGVSGSATGAEVNTNTLTVYETIPAGTAASQWTIQHDCYQVQSTLWQDTGVNGVAGIQLDVYQGEQEIGVCNVSQQTAQRITWNTITPDEAWAEYDTAWVA